MKKGDSFKQKIANAEFDKELRANPEIKALYAYYNDQRKERVILTSKQALQQLLKMRGMSNE